MKIKICPTLIILSLLLVGCGADNDTGDQTANDSQSINPPDQTPSTQDLENKIAQTRKNVFSQDTPQGALLKYISSLENHDEAMFLSVIHANDRIKQALGGTVGLARAVLTFQKAFINKYGARAWESSKFAEQLTDLSPGLAALKNEIESVNITVADDRAVGNIPGGEPLYFIRKNGVWFLDLTVIQVKGFETEQAAQVEDLIAALKKAVDEMLFNIYQPQTTPETLKKEFTAQIAQIFGRLQQKTLNQNAELKNNLLFRPGDTQLELQLEQVIKTYYQKLASDDLNEIIAAHKSLLPTAADFEVLFPQHHKQLWDIVAPYLEQNISYIDLIAQAEIRKGKVKNIALRNLRREKKEEYIDALTLIDQDIPIYEVVIVQEKQTSISSAYLFVNNRWIWINDIGELLEKIR